MSPNVITEPEFAHHLAIAEHLARKNYTPEVLRERGITRLKNLLSFTEADITNESMIYDGFDRAQTRRHAIVVRDLVAAEIDRRRR